jgi:phosphoglycolate phosphatase
MLNTIIFDLDGTLADSVGCIVETVHIVEDALAIPRVPDAEIRGMIGRPLTAIFTELHALDGDLLQRAIEIYKRDYVRMTGMYECLFEGGIEVLTALRQQGFNLAIATGKDQVGAENACARLGLTPYFDSIHGILPGTPGKPHPAILHRVMESLGASPESCVLIGDTTHDMQLAQAANIAAIGVKWGVHSEAEMAEYGVQVATSMSEMLAMVLDLAATTQG